MRNFDTSEGHSFYQPERHKPPARSEAKPWEHSTPMMRELATVIQRERLAQNLSYRDVSDKSGVSSCTVRGVEHARNCPSVDTAACILGALGYELAVVKKQ